MYCLIDVLGEGATARVSCYSKGSDVVVIKSVKPRGRLEGTYDASARALLNEKSMLTKLAEHNPADAEHVWVAPESVIPRIAFDLGSDVDICLTPLCEPFVFPTSNRARKTVVHDILSALFHAACLGLVHRDVRPDNIMLRQDDSRRAMLIDWGFAVPEGDPVVYQGTGVFASQRVLLARDEASSNASGKEFPVFPADDVCSLVKVLASLDLALTSLPSKQAAKAQYKFWERALKGKLLSYLPAYELAEQLLKPSTLSLSARYKEVETEIFRVIDTNCLDSVPEEE
jgi:serine/threonine protein kinase